MSRGPPQASLPGGGGQPRSALIPPRCIAQMRALPHLLSVSHRLRAAGPIGPRCVFYAFLPIWLLALFRDHANSFPVRLRKLPCSVSRAATTIVNSEIGRRKANDTKFIVPPQPAAAAGRSSTPGRHRQNDWGKFRRMQLRFPSICSAPEVQRPQALSRTWTEDRLGKAGSLLAPTTERT